MDQGGFRGHDSILLIDYRWEEIAALAEEWTAAAVHLCGGISAKRDGQGGL